jgi:hypothetical protein
MKNFKLLLFVLVVFVLGATMIFVSSAQAAFPKEDCWKDTAHVPSGGDFTSIINCCSHGSIVKRGLPIAHSERTNVCVTACNALSDIYLTKDHADDFINNCCTGGMGGIAAVNDATRKLQSRCQEAKDAKRGRAVGTSSCPSGQSYVKKAPGVGPMQCGTNQCRPDGNMFFTACVTKSECGVMRGSTDNNNKAGCTQSNGVELFCCRTPKNRCNSASKDPNKLFLCTSSAECTGKGAKPFAGGPSGCNPSGNFPVCCEFVDSANSPMKVIGESLLPASAVARGKGGSAKDQKSLFTGRIERPYENIDSFCFSKKECSESLGVYEAGHGCPFKGDQEQGYCLAPEVEYELQSPFFGVTQISGLRNLIGLVFNSFIGVLVIVSAMFFIWGAFKYMISSVVKSIEKSKTIMVDAVVGLAIGLGAFAILANINPNVLTLTKPKIYMINRITFYHVVYCNDLINKELKVMDAGTSLKPLSYSAQLSSTGFDTEIEKALCGNEYYIEGGDSQAICMGQFCGAGGGSICVNCTTGLSKACKSSSALEHVCADCKVGGNIVTSNRFVPNKVNIFLFCVYDEGSGIEFDAKQVGEVDIQADENNRQSTASAGGFVTNMCFQKMEIGPSAVDTYKDECEKKKPLYKGMIILAGVDEELEGFTAQGLLSAKEKIENNPIETGMRVGGYAVGIIPAIFSAVYDANKDNIYFPINKMMCNSNLLDSSLPFTKGFLSEFFSADEAGFEGIMKEFYDFSATNTSKKSDRLFDKVFEEKVVWSFDEAKQIVAGGMRGPCSFAVYP